MPLDNTFSFYIGCSDWHHSGEDNELQLLWAKAGHTVKPGNKGGGGLGPNQFTL